MVWMWRRLWQCVEGFIHLKTTKHTNWCVYVCVGKRGVHVCTADENVVANCYGYAMRHAPRIHNLSFGKLRHPHILVCWWAAVNGSTVRMMTRMTVKPMTRKSLFAQLFAFVRISLIFVLLPEWHRWWRPMRQSRLLPVVCHCSHQICHRDDVASKPVPQTREGEKKKRTQQIIGRVCTVRNGWNGIGVADARKKKLLHTNR